MRVLIAHAHPIVVLGLTDLLHTLEYALVGSVASGQEAILAAGEHQPDLMLVDVDLKGEMDGITAAIEIHNRLGIRSIVLAEQFDRTVRAHAAEALPIAILDKTSPISVIADALRIASLRTIHWPWPLRAQATIMEPKSTPFDASAGARALFLIRGNTGAIPHEAGRARV